MASEKENLEKLVQFITDISEKPENEWFKKQLVSSLVVTSETSIENPIINEIYEYCIRVIIKEQAEKFYENFKLVAIKDQLIQDFVRMEKFRREGNFEDFCLATFQQFELIVNYLSSQSAFKAYINSNYNSPALNRYDISSESYVPIINKSTISSLIFKTLDKDKIQGYTKQPIDSLYFDYKYRAVLFYYYFNKLIKYNTEAYDRIYNIGFYLYQGRNLNHRGGQQSPYQRNIVDQIIPNKNKYYFKFMGFLEDFCSTINENY